MKDKLISYSLGLGVLALTILIGASSLSYIDSVSYACVKESTKHSEIFTGGIMQVGSLLLLFLIAVFGIVLAFIISKYQKQEEKS
jgi:uncharacterized membrane protein